MATKAMAQDFIICDMCKTSPVQLHCNTCGTNLCHGCVAKHILDDNDEDHHDVVLFKKKNTKPIFPICQVHTEQNCEMKCKQCDTPVCVNCVTSGDHQNHKLLAFLKLFNSQKDIVKRTTTELETSTYPKYEKAVSELEVQLQNLPQDYDRLIQEISKQGEAWHREIDIIINRQKQEVEKMKTDALVPLKKLLEEMRNHQSTLRQAIIDNNGILQSANVTKVLDSKYTSPEKWDPPPSFDVIPPTFTPLPIQGEQLHQMFGTLTAAVIPLPLSLVEDKVVETIKQLQPIDSPKSPSNINTEYNRQYNITCPNPDEVWVCGDVSYIKRFTSAGSLQETVTTTTGNAPKGLTVTTQGDLIYTDYGDKSISRVRLGKIEKIISLKQGWRPLTACCTSSDELLIPMEKSSTPRRIVRYSGSTEKQVIQFDDQGKPLFSSPSSIFSRSYLYIAEDSTKSMICVSEKETSTVVVVNQAGKLRFRYTGNLSSQKVQKSFSPRGVVIDSMGRILVADCDNHCIHLIDQEGQFIQYIENCQLNYPYDLSLDKSSILYIVELKTSQVKVFNYLS